MSIAVVSQVVARCRIVRAISLRAVSDRIVGLCLTVGDGPTNDRASGKPAEHSWAGVPAMMPAAMAVAVMPPTILHGLKRPD